MSKTLVAVLTAVIAVVVSVCLTVVVLKVIDKDDKDAEEKVVTVIEDAKEDNNEKDNNKKDDTLDADRQKVTGSSEYGDVNIKSARLDERGFVWVTFEYTNKYAVVTCFDNHYLRAAYQNGVQLEDQILAELSSTTIQPGVTIEFEVGYYLEDQNSKVEIQVTNDSEYDDYFLVSRTFYLS